MAGLWNSNNLAAPFPKNEIVTYKFGFNGLAKCREQLLLFGAGRVFAGLWI